MIIPIQPDSERGISVIEIDLTLRKVIIYFLDSSQEKREYKPEEWKDSILRISI